MYLLRSVFEFFRKFRFTEEVLVNLGHHFFFGLAAAVVTRAVFLSDVGMETELVFEKFNSVIVHMIDFRGLVFKPDVVNNINNNQNYDKPN